MSFRSAAQLLLSFLDDEIPSQEPQLVCEAAIFDAPANAIPREVLSHGKVSIDSALTKQDSDTESDTEILPAVPEKSTAVTTRAAAQRLVSFLDEVSPIQIPNQNSATVSDRTPQTMLQQDTPCLTQTNGETQNSMFPRNKKLLPRLQEVWHQLPRHMQADPFGYGRNPAFWFTLNFPYNYSYEVHRFAEATRTAATPTRETFLVPRVATSARPHEEDIGDDEGPALTTECPKVPHPVLDPVSRDVHAGREAWSKDHADIVVFMHAVKVELTVQHIMRLVVHETDHEPFQYWLRFEFGTNTGNPHAHGMAYAAGNPHFDSVVADEETRQRLLSAKKHIEDLTT